MDQLSKVLKVLLKRMPYEPFLKNEIDCMPIDKELFYKAVHMYLPHYSDTEVRIMLRELADSLENYSAFLKNGMMERKGPASVFDAIFRFADAMLLMRNNEVMFHYEKALRWRTTTVDIGEEVFVTAFLARYDLREGREREYFAWPPIISHNNAQLRNITRRGMAENHFHLWGSAPYYQLSWINLMNGLDNVKNYEREDAIDRNLRTTYKVYDKEFPEESMQSCCRKAALIRLFLFTRITGTELELGTYYVNWQYFWPWIAQQEGEISSNEFNTLLKDETGNSVVEIIKKVSEKAHKKQNIDPLEKFYLVLEQILDKRIDLEKMNRDGQNVSIKDILSYAFEQQGIIRLRNGRALLSDDKFNELWLDETYKKTVYYLKYPDAFERNLDQIQSAIDSLNNRYQEKLEDYALSAIHFKTYSGQDIYYLLSGERYFLYEMFRRVERNDESLSPHMYNMFYAYLIMKEKIRGELVQSNEWVGFENFSIYERRKWDFLGSEKMEMKAAEMAIMSCMQQNVKLLEIRISPRKTAEENFQQLQFLDRAIGSKKKIRDCCFFVFHFIKRPDELVPDALSYSYRHESLRKKIREEAQALIEFRRLYPETAGKVLGIDAASQEIGCRPEIFAQVFRTLQHDIGYRESESGLEVIPQLQATYHVGEDFLDIVDGLRAIDEAILFLELDCGDRLGHALALGINVKDWYSSKQNHISLSKQDYLDNIVWMYHTIVRYHIYCQDNLKNRIEEEYHRYFNEIYGCHFNQEFIKGILEASGNQGYIGNLNFDINAYYNAWKLRGDAPELYRDGYFKMPEYSLTGFGAHAVNENYPDNFDIRKKPEVAMLYYYYHYDKNVRIEGRKGINIKVKEDYIKAVELIQKAMQKEIARRGLAIETNPSSNVLIGTFSHYDEHPITQFYNNGLTWDVTKLMDSAQIWTSINTDDQGVFGTILENEYALVARALEKKKDEEGNPIYQKAMIYDWLDKIRTMGIDQSFANLSKQMQENE